MSAPRNDPIRQSRYELEIDGIIRAGFSEVTISNRSCPPIEYREGNEKFPTVRKIPGLAASDKVTCKCGITKDSIELYNWFKQVEEGKFKSARRNVRIILLDSDGETEAASWEFAYAWPTSYTPPGLIAKGNDVGIEQLEFVHEGMKRTK